MACMARTCLAWGAKKQCRETLRSTSQLETCRSQHFQQKKRSFNRGIKFENPCWFTMAFGSTSNSPNQVWSFGCRLTYTGQLISNTFWTASRFRKLISEKKKDNLRGNFLHWQVDGLGLGLRLGRAVSPPILVTHLWVEFWSVLFQPSVATRDRIEPNITVESSASSMGEIKSPQPPRGWPFYLGIGNDVSTCGETWAPPHTSNLYIYTDPSINSMSTLQTCHVHDASCFRIVSAS